MEINLSIDTGYVKTRLCEFIMKQVTNAGMNKAVINLSGGLDSSVSCILAVQALGADNILALRLPYKTSSPDSLNHAQMVIDMLGIKSRTIPITEMVDQVISGVTDTTSVRKGNIMARIRMIIAFDQSAAYKGLVVGTGNKTEILLGYTTLYGDSASAFNPLGDLYKTQVRQLARALDVPEVIISKPPSADLWLGQTDEGELGFTYADVDRLLYLLIDQRLPPAECVNAGFNEAFVRKVMEQIRRNEFKHLLPAIASLTKSTVGPNPILEEWTS